MTTTAKSTAAPGPLDVTAGNDTYLDGLERELAGWSARLSRASGLPRKLSRTGRIEHRKRILVSKVRRRNIESRLAAMRASQARFRALQPGLLLLWKLFTSGIEKAES
jgi:hypothetical protein